jgi:flagellar biosynthesis/type III secretory pathway M-ring protein FliF/YscJ
MKPWLRSYESLRIFLVRSNAQTKVALFFCSAMLVVGIALLVQNSNGFSQRMEALLDGQDFSVEQLDQFEFAFSNAGLKAYERSTNRMRIPTASRDAYLKALSQAKCLPSKSLADEQLAGNTLQILEPRSLSERRDRQYRIKRIEDTLAEFPFIRQAIVTYDEKTDGFAAERKRSATVSIQPRSHVELTRSQKGSIIRLVLKSFPGLKATDVVLVDLKRGETYADPSLEFESLADASNTANEWKWVELRKHFEEDLQKKALALLAGYGDVKVVATADWNAEASRSQSAIEHQANTPSQPTKPAETLAAQQTEKTGEEASESKSDNASASTPSLITNRRATLGTRTTVAHSRGQSKGQATNQPLMELSPTAVSLAVSLPSSYYQKAYLQQWQWENPGQSTSTAPAMTPETLQKLRDETILRIRKTLAPLLLSTIGTNELVDRIAVSEHYDAPVSAIAGIGNPQAIIDWLNDSWRMLSMLAVLLTAMFFLRSIAMHRPAGPSPFVAENANDSVVTDQLILSEQHEINQLHQETDRDDSVEILSVPEVLAQDRFGAIAKSDPEKLAARLSAWISSN